MTVLMTKLMAVLTPIVSLLRSRLLLMIVLTGSGQAWAIVGGVAAADGDSPGQVALVDVTRDVGTCVGTEAFCKQFCSGVLITKQWVLTAAHCVNNVLPSDLRVVVGTKDLSTANASHLIAVTRSVVHGQYAIGATYNNDIALLQLASPVEQPVASIAEAAAYATFVANTAEHDDGVIASGWGRLSSTGGFPTALRKVAINLLSDSVCDAAYNGTLVRYVASNMLCAAETTPALMEQGDAGDFSPEDATGEGVCNYDSGGPLAFVGNGFRQVAGLTSFAPQGDCASPTLASVFTKVSSYASWIEATGKEANDFFGDLALTITGDKDKSPGAPATISVQLRNASGLPAGVVLPATNLTGAGFTVVAPAGTTLALSGSPAQLTCAAIAGGYRCTSSTELTPSTQRTATFTVTPSAGNQDVEIAAEAFTDAANNLVDYRQGNNQRQHRILFSSLPDVALQVTGFTQQVVNFTPATATTAATADGRAWVMARVTNRSGQTAATATDIALTLPAGWVWEAWENLPECSAHACQLTGLAAGETRTFRARVFSPGAVAGNVALSVVAANGDFPAVSGGLPDAQGGVDVSFNVVVDNTDPEDPPVDPPEEPEEPPVMGVSDGGSVDFYALLMLLVVGLGIRRRTA
jgi:secreted trypsin-like serine protease